MGKTVDFIPAAPGIHPAKWVVRCRVARGEGKTRAEAEANHAYWYDLTLSHLRGREATKRAAKKRTVPPTAKRDTKGRFGGC